MHTARTDNTAQRSIPSYNGFKQRTLLLRTCCAVICSHLARARAAADTVPYEAIHGSSKVPHAYVCSVWPTGCAKTHASAGAKA